MCIRDSYPCDVIHLDTGWFRTDWLCEWKFNEERFPDPKAVSYTHLDVYKRQVQHDVEGLIDLFGGKEKFANKLDSLFFLESSAENTGFTQGIKRARIAILLCTGILTATTTAFCGPISFIGLAVRCV